MFRDIVVLYLREDLSTVWTLPVQDFIAFHLSILCLHNKYARGEKEDDSLYGVEPQPCESRIEWKCVRRPVKCLTDVGLMFAQSTAEQAAEDHVKQSGVTSPASGFTLSTEPGTEPNSLKLCVNQLFLP